MDSHREQPTSNTADEAAKVIFEKSSTLYCNIHLFLNQGKISDITAPNLPAQATTPSLSVNYLKTVALPTK